jgi:hypothetical protein
VANDHDGTGGVPGTLLADRAEKKGGKTSSPARSNNEQFSVFCRLDQDMCGCSLDDAPLDVDAFCRVAHSLE